MNFSALTLELLTALLASVILLFDLWAAPGHKRRAGDLALVGLLMILGISFMIPPGAPATADNMLAQDALAIFFQRFFLVAAVFVVVIANHYSERLPVGFAEFHVILLLALTGMLLAAAVNDLILLFVALELISISFYVLVSFQRNRLASLEAGVKYLILSAMAASILVFGIAFIFGAANATNLVALHAAASAYAHNHVYVLGVLLLAAGLSFKIAAFPLQIWAPDVYQGAPTPVTAFLAIASKAAGFVLLLRFLFMAVPGLAEEGDHYLMAAAGVTILYGNLCAIPQRNLKRLLGYSSIANAGYLLLGVTALNASGAAAVLYYLGGYLFTLAAAFTVIAVAMPDDNDDIGRLAGLGRRSPFLAAVLTVAMVSLAGIPPLAGFLGKFMLLKALLEHGGGGAYCLLGIAIAGVVISLYYYFGVIRAMYWGGEAQDHTPVRVPIGVRISLLACVGGIFYLGVYPDCVMALAAEAVKSLGVR